MGARLPVAHAILLGVVGGPVAFGLAGTLLPAFGYFPALDGASFSLDAFRRLQAEPALWHSLRLSLWTGFAATALSLFLTFCILARIADRKGTLGDTAGFVPLLALPPIALAIGFALLVAPSGLIIRLLAAPLGLDAPPDLSTVQDSAGFALIFGLALKETPFLVAFGAAALIETSAAQRIMVARSLGMPRHQAFLRAAWPVVLTRLRLPLAAVLVYATSSVDAAIILGPTTPPPLQVVVLRLARDPDLSLRFAASAGALLQAAAALFAVALWFMLGAALSAPMRLIWLPERLASPISFLFGWMLKAFGALAVLALLLASVAGRRPFPQVLPDRFTLQGFTDQGALFGAPLVNALVLGVGVAVIAVAVTIAALEADRADGRVLARLMPLLLMPLVVPEPSFLLGLSTGLLAVGVFDPWVSVMLAHLSIATPYVLLTLRAPWLRRNRSPGDAARSLGAGRLRRLLRVLLPPMLPSLVLAMAVAFAVSNAQYLGTLLPGGGRLITLSTETMAIVAGADARTVAVSAFSIAILPAFGFLVAFVTARLCATRSRRISLT